MNIRHLPKALAMAVCMTAANAGAIGMPEKPSGSSCCVVVGVDRHRSVVTAEDRLSGQMYSFVVRDRLKLGAVHAGQEVMIDLDANRVVLDPVCRETRCALLAVSLPAK